MRGRARARPSARQPQVPAPQALEEAVRGQVQLDRRDRDAVVEDRVDVGPGDRLPGGRRPADPVVGDAARVGPPDQLVLVDPLAEPGDLDPGARLERDGRHVHVEELGRLEAALEDRPGDHRGGRGREREVVRREVVVADRERRAAREHGLHRGADRPRVGDVVAEVGAVVDPARDEVDRTGEQAQEDEPDRVRRRAVDRPGRASRRPAFARAPGAGATSSASGRPRSGSCRARSRGPRRGPPSPGPGPAGRATRCRRRS